MRLVLAACLALAGPVWGHGDLHESIQEVTAAIAKSPPQDLGALYLQRAGLHAAHEDPEAAAADYDRAEAMKADPLAVWLGRGKLQLSTGRHADACATLDLLITREPRHVEALITRARARAKLHDTSRAIEDFSAGIAASSRPEPDYYLERAAVLAATTPPRLDEAIRGLDEGLKQLGTGVITLQLAAIDLEVRAGRVDAALARIDRSAASSPRKETWLIRRGDLLALSGRPTEAALAYQSALAAIATLPQRVQAARATAEMEKKARQALAALSGHP
jgi:predicted Zn-dependent protease